MQHKIFKIVLIKLKIIRFNKKNSNKENSILKNNFLIGNPKEDLIIKIIIKEINIKDKIKDIKNQLKSFNLTKKVLNKKVINY